MKNDVSSEAPPAEGAQVPGSGVPAGSAPAETGGVGGSDLPRRGPGTDAKVWLAVIAIIISLFVFYHNDRISKLRTLSDATIRELERQVTKAAEERRSLQTQHLKELQSERDNTQAELERREKLHKARMDTELDRVRFEADLHRAALAAGSTLNCTTTVGAVMSSLEGIRGLHDSLQSLRKLIAPLQASIGDAAKARTDALEAQRKRHEDAYLTVAAAMEIGTPGPNIDKKTVDEVHNSYRDYKSSAAVMLKNFGRWNEAIVLLLGRWEGWLGERRTQSKADLDRTGAVLSSLAQALTDFDVEIEALIKGALMTGKDVGSKGVAEAAGQREGVPVDAVWGAGTRDVEGLRNSLKLAKASLEKRINEIRILAELFGTD